jgi:outer membrane biosynthesis protein TonB
LAKDSTGLSSGLRVALLQIEVAIEATRMKIIEVLRIASLFLLPGAIGSVYAQEHEQEKKPEAKQQQAKPEQQKAKPAQEQAKPAQQQHAQQQAKPTQQPAKPAQQAAKPVQQQQHAQQQAKPAAQQQQANRAQPAAPHGQIPDARFRASFGRGHTFHVAQSAGGSRRFQYGGYWFAMGNPWPVGWLYTDNVYVDYMNGGYFLCDPVHPGVYLSITIG